MNTTAEVLERLERPVNINRLIEQLVFELDDFERANLQQPKLYLEAGRYRTLAVLEKLRAEYRLEVAESARGFQLRNLDGKKLTEKAISERLGKDKKIRQFRKDFYLARAVDEWSKHLIVAYEQRLQVLNNITKIRVQEVASELRAVKEDAAVSSMKKLAEKMRREREEE